jgi:hypothetical protein
MRVVARAQSHASRACAARSTSSRTHLVTLSLGDWGWGRPHVRACVRAVWTCGWHMQGPPARERGNAAPTRQAPHDPTAAPLLSTYGMLPHACTRALPRSLGYLYGRRPYLSLLPTAQALVGILYMHAPAARPHPFLVLPTLPARTILHMHTS